MADDGINTVSAYTNIKYMNRVSSRNDAIIVYAEQVCDMVDVVRSAGNGRTVWTSPRESPWLWEPSTLTWER